MNIGSIIKKYRISKKISQGSFAADLQISQNYLSMVELEKKTPSPDLVTRFSKKSGISLNAIYVMSSDTPAELNGEDIIKFSQLQQTLKDLILT